MSNPCWYKIYKLVVEQHNLHIIYIHKITLWISMTFCWWAFPTVKQMTFASQVLKVETISTLSRMRFTLVFNSSIPSHEHLLGAPSLKRTRVVNSINSHRSFREKDKIAIYKRTKKICTHSCTHPHISRCVHSHSQIPGDELWILKHRAVDPGAIWLFLATRSVRKSVIDVLG